MNEQLRQVVEAVLRACDARAATARNAGAIRARRPAVIAAGKAAPGMYRGFMDVFPGEHARFMVVPAGVAAPEWARVADHPVPTERCAAAGRELVTFVRSMVDGGECDGFVVLLSGGSSALLTLPLQGLELEKYAGAMRELIARGTEIGKLNAIRKHFEQIKGGKLAAMMGPLSCETFILSDVIGDDPSTVGSGPTVADPTTVEDVRAALREAGSETMRILLGMEIPETPKDGDPVFEGSSVTIVGSNEDAVRAAVGSVRGMGFEVAAVRRGVLGEASAAGRALAEAALAARRPGAVVFGGETTVDASGARGVGGRNQELALAAAVAIDGCEGVAVCAFGTDGVDGPTDAAGAVVTGETCRGAREMGLDVGRALAGHDSHGFFTAMERGGRGCLIRTGPTGTNVNDVAVALVY